PTGTGRIGSLASPRLGQRLGRLRLRSLAEHLIEREVDERRAARRADRRADRVVDQSRNLGGLERRGGELGQRTDKREMIDLLEGALPPAELWGAAAQ